MYYDEGWNDFIDGKPCPKRMDWMSDDYLEGWQDCKEATEKYGQQSKI